LQAPSQEARQKRSAAGQRSNAAAAYVLDPEGRMIAELKQLAQRPLQQLHEDVRPQALEGAEWPEAMQAEQPAGGGPPVGRALQEQIAQAIRPVLGVILAVHLGIAQAPQEDEQDVAPTAVLDRDGKVIATLKPLPPLREEEQPQTQERVPEPQAE
jgi:hypothetical protein